MNLTYDRGDEVRARAMEAAIAAAGLDDGRSRLREAKIVHVSGYTTKSGTKSGTKRGAYVRGSGGAHAKLGDVVQGLTHAGKNITGKLGKSITSGNHNVTDKNGKKHDISDFRDAAPSGRSTAANPPTSGRSTEAPSRPRSQGGKRPAQAKRPDAHEAAHLHIADRMGFPDGPNDETNDEYAARMAKGKSKAEVRQMADRAEKVASGSRDRGVQDLALNLRDGLRGVAASRVG